MSDNGVAVSVATISVLGTIASRTFTSEKSRAFWNICISLSTLAMSLVDSSCSSIVSQLNFRKSQLNLISFGLKKLINIISDNLIIRKLLGKI